MTINEHLLMENRNKTSSTVHHGIHNNTRQKTVGTMLLSRDNLSTTCTATPTASLLWIHWHGSAAEVTTTTTHLILHTVY